MRGLAVATLALLTFAPAALAQVLPEGGLQVDVQAPLQPIVPEAGRGLLKATFQVDCRAVATSAPVQDRTIRVSISVANPGFVVTGPLSVVVPSQDCLRGASIVEFTEEYTVTATRNAPGLTAVAGQFMAEMPRTQTSQADARAQQQFILVADYMPLLHARVAGVTHEGGRTVYAIDLANYGNAQTVVEFHVDPATAPAGLQLEASPVQHGDPRHNATARVSVGGGGPVQIVAVPRAALAPDRQGLPLTLTLNADANPVPGPELLAAVGALGALAARSRRRTS
jgi:hypothetical protein